MLQRGRKSAAQQQVDADVAAKALVQRLEPPDDLPPEEWAVWKKTIMSRETAWFQPEHEPLLRTYCTAVVTYRELARRLRSLRPSQMALYGEVRRMMAEEAKVVLSFARAMRLTQQSIYHRERAGAHTWGGRGRGARPWDTDE